MPRVHSRIFCGTLVGLAAITALLSATILALALLARRPDMLIILLTMFLGLPIVIVFLLCQIDDVLDEMLEPCHSHQDAVVERLLMAKYQGRLLGRSLKMRSSARKIRYWSVGISQPARTSGEFNVEAESALDQLLMFKRRGIWAVPPRHS